MDYKKVTEDAKELILASTKKAIVKGIKTILIFITIITLVISALYLIPGIKSNEALYRIYSLVCESFGMDPPVKFKPVYYVNYDANGGMGSMNTTTHFVEEKSKLAKNQFSKPGYDFVGWELEIENGVLRCSDEQSVIRLADKDENITLKAIWELHTYKVTYHLNGGVYIAKNTYPTEYTIENAAISVPAIEYATKPDSILFLGWYEDSTYTIPFNNDLQSKPRELNLYPKWETTTYYSIDSIPAKLKDGPITLDLSQESNTNFLNHTERKVINSKYNTIVVENSVSQLVLIGNQQKTFRNLCIELRNFKEDQELILLLDNFNFVTNENSAFILSDCKNIKLTIVTNGESSIKTSIPGGNAINIGTSDLEIKGTGKLSIVAGNGVTSANGSNGGIAVIADAVIISENISCNIIGGNGGNGNSDDGFGGTGGCAIDAAEITVLSPKTIKFIGGAGGNGGMIGGASARGTTCGVQCDPQTSNIIITN